MTAIMDGQGCLFDPVTASGRTYREPYPATTGKTSKPSSRSSQGSGSRTLPMCLCLRRENGPKPGASTMSWGGWSIAYRIHDAQYWGVPQRRRRISVLADFNGLSAAEILFDPQLRGETENTEPHETERDSGREPGREVPPVGESVPGDFESCGAERQGTADGVESGAGSAISFQERAGKPGGAKESSFSVSTQESSQPSTTRAYSIQGNTIDRDAKQNGGVFP